MDAVILVGGQGTRMRPLTITTPKPMLPTAGVPFVLHQLVRLRDAGVDHVVLSTSYKPEVFSDHFGDGSSIGLRLDYCTEVEPLGTGGGIRNVAELLGDSDFLVCNGDVLSALDIPALLATHRSRSADVTLYLTEVDDPRPFGLVPLDDDGRVTAFLEKPQAPEQIVTNRINAGCYVFTRSVLNRIPAGRPVSIERETFPQLLEEGARVFGHVDTCYWLDLGTPAAFVQGSVDLVLGRVFSSAVPDAGSDALALQGAVIEKTATVGGGTTLGEGARVEAGAMVMESVLFAGAHIGEGAVVRRSVIGRDAVVGADTVLDGAVIGDGAHIGARNELVAGARVWPNVRIPDAAIRFSSDR